MIYALKGFRNIDLRISFSIFESSKYELMRRLARGKGKIFGMCRFTEHIVIPHTEPLFSPTV